jgi:hypothetical protein
MEGKVYIYHTTSSQFDVRRGRSPRRLSILRATKLVVVSAGAFSLLNILALQSHSDMVLVISWLVLTLHQLLREVISGSTFGSS